MNTSDLIKLAHKADLEGDIELADYLDSQLIRVSQNVFTKGFSELGSVLKQLKNLPQLKAYLLAFFTFSMGIQTIMQMASLFGTKEVWQIDSETGQMIRGLKTGQLIMAVLMVQVIAIHW